VVALPPGLAIAELAAALSRCRLHVGPDSGVLHLAMALGTPTLALFRDHPEMGEWLPRGPSHRHLSSPCPCVGQAHPPCRAVGIPRCLQANQPGAVARLAEADWWLECMTGALQRPVRAFAGMPRFSRTEVESTEAASGRQVVGGEDLTFPACPLS
jgi:hypothetical protein